MSGRIGFSVIQAQFQVVVEVGIFLTRPHRTLGPLGSLGLTGPFLKISSKVALTPLNKSSKNPPKTIGK